MKYLRHGIIRKLFETGSCLLGVIWLLGLSGCGLSEDEMQRRDLESLTGVPFPSMMPPVVIKDRNAKGKDFHFYRLRIYELQDAWEWLEEPDCSTHGLTRGLFAQIPVIIEPVMEHVHLDQDLCFRVMAQTRSTRAVFIQDNKLVYYFRLHLPQRVEEEAHESGPRKS